MSRIAGVLKKAQEEQDEQPLGQQEGGGATGQAAPAGESAAAAADEPWQLEQGGATPRPAWPNGRPDAGTADGPSNAPRRFPRRLGSGERGRGGQNALVRRGDTRLTPAGAGAGMSPYGGEPSGPPGPPPILHYWYALRRRWRMGLLIFFVVVVGAVAGLLLAPPWYTATGLIEIKPEQASAAPVQELFDPSKMATDDLLTQYGILRSDTLASRVLMQMQRNGTPALVPPPWWNPAPLLAKIMPAPAGAGPRTPGVPTPDDIKKFHQLLVVDPQEGSRLVNVSYTFPISRVSAMTVNAVLDNYLQMRMEDAQRTEQWLGREMQAAQQKLEASERRLQAYIRDHGLQAVETGKGELAVAANQRLAALHDALEKAREDRFEKQSQEELARNLSAARDVDSPVVQNLAVRLADLRREQARLSATFHDDYPALKAVNDQISQLERELTQESQFVVSRGERQYKAALRQEMLLENALAEQNKIVQALGEQAGGRPGYESLTRDLVMNQDQFTLLNQKLKEIGIAAALRTTNVAIVDRGKPPVTPDGLPLPIMFALIGIVGVTFGVGGIFLREYFDTSMRTVADIESLGVPALATIPSAMVPRTAFAQKAQWRRIDEGQSPLAEAFAALRNAVLLSEGAIASSRVLLVTSAQAAEGKTTISINLALSLARLNFRVLLVDANLRFPCVQQALNLPDGPGLVDYLASGGDWHNSLHRAVRPNLDVLAGARPQTSPADLLSLPPLGQMLDEASLEYDFVVIDSPALLAHPADVHSLAAVVDNVLFTVRHGTTPREAVAMALSQLDRVSGVVLNRFAPASGGFRWKPVPATVSPAS